MVVITVNDENIAYNILKILVNEEEQNKIKTFC